jgi:hypothetical protein
LNDKEDSLFNGLLKLKEEKSSVINISGRNEEKSSVIDIKDVNGE